MTAIYLIYLVVEDFLVLYTCFHGCVVSRRQRKIYRERQKVVV
jgi:hypothetical protein